MEPAAIVGWLAAACSAVSMTPQAISALRGSDLSGVSLPTYLLIFTAVTLWLIYGALIGDYPLIATNILSFCTSGIVLLSLLRQRAKRDKTIRRA